MHNQTLTYPFLSLSLSLARERRRALTHMLACEHSNTLPHTFKRSLRHGSPSSRRIIIHAHSCTKYRLLVIRFHSHHFSLSHAPTRTHTNINRHTRLHTHGLMHHAHTHTYAYTHTLYHLVSADTKIAPRVRRAFQSYFPWIQLRLLLLLLLLPSSSSTTTTKTTTETSSALTESNAFQ